MTIATSRVQRDALAALTKSATFPVHVPGDPGYDAARRPWNLAVDQRPAVVAEPAEAHEVAAAVRAARAAGLRIAAQGPGHNPGPLAARGLDDVMLVRTHRMRGVEVDPERRVARVLGGSPSIDVVEAAAAHGLAVLHGSSPDVSFAGLALGGGTFLYGRKLGLTTNSLLAVELVTADGEMVRASATENPDLFWALRGGGGSFGVVTALEVRLFPLADVFAGMMLWPAERAADVTKAWARWAVDAPDEVTTTLRVLRVPPIPDVPDLLRGREVVLLDGAVLDTDERAAEILAPLRALAPELDTFSRVPAAAVARLHMDPEGPTPSASGTATFDALPGTAIDTLLDGFAHAPALMVVELRQLGGALGRPEEGCGAVSRLPGQFLLYAVGIAPTPDLVAAAHAQADAVVAAMTPWETGRHYLSFAESAVDPRTGYDDDTWALLQAIRATVDPDRVLAANHPVA